MNEIIESLSEKAFDDAVAASKVDPTKCLIGSDYFQDMEREIYTALVVEYVVKNYDTIKSDFGIN